MKTFAFTFAIGAMMTHGFFGAFASASRSLKNINTRMREVAQEQKKLAAAMKDGAISADQYKARMDKLNGTLGKLQNQRGALAGFMSAKSNLGTAISTFSATAMAVQAVAQPVAGMVTIAADYQSAMSKVAAITGANADEMAQLSATARQLGEQTKFTAKESADAMSFLGMAGWKSQQIIAGMPGLLNLAAAGGTDLARTADIVSDNLTAFGLAAEQSGHMADVYATVITNTNTNVELLGETMKYAAPVAHAFGASMEETAAMAGLMANAGIKGSQAGTSLRAGLMRLAGPPKMAASALAELGLSMEDITAEQKEATMAMQSLGISMSDDSGPRKMSAILSELRSKFQGLSQEQQLSYAKSIFGQQAAAGWLAVLNSEDGAFDDLLTRLNNCDGAAGKMAATMQNNLNGAMTRFKSATESIAISVGTALLPALTWGADKLTALASSASQFAAAHPKLVQGLVMVGAGISAVALAITGFGVISAVATLASAAFQAGLVAVTGALGPVGLAIAAVIAVGTALYLNWDQISAFAVTTWNNITTTVSSAWMGIKAAISNAMTSVKNGIMQLPSTVAYAIGYAVGLYMSLPRRILNALIGLTQVGAQIISDALAWGQGAVEGLIGWFSQLPDNLMGIISGLSTVGSQFISEAGDWGSEAVDAIVDWFGNLPGRLSGLVSEAWESAKSFLGSAASGYAAAQASAGNVAENANGGIYNRGAFLTTFAEDSGESAIPHKPTARNIGLLAKTNQIMGNPLGGNITASFAPQINISGGSNVTAEEVGSMLSQKMREFEDMLKQLEHQRRRVAYA